MPNPDKPDKISVSETPEETVSPAEGQPDDELDPETEQAVDDIAAQESDDLLAAQDEMSATPPSGKKPGRLSRLRAGWSAWWHNPLKRRATLAVLAVALVATAVTPASRYFVLNTAGVRSQASLVVLDDSTQLPLKNVSVTLGNLTATTDKAGQATFKNIRLGSTKLNVHKRAFAPKEQTVTIGWGSNPLEPLRLKPVGSQYRFVVTDYLSAQPLIDVEAASGDASAVSNQQGEITLTIDLDGEGQTAEVSVGADGYRTETIILNLESEEEIKAQLVPAKAHIFISRRSGRYDVYKIDADGQNEEKVLAGSGVERDDLVLVEHPSKAFAALVSTRENVRKDGFLLSTLTLIDIAEKTPAKIAQSERIQLIDWIGDRLVYVQIAAGASASDPQRHRLMSYNLADGQTKELAAANYFNDVMAVGNQIFYAPSAAYATDAAAFYKVGADGGNQQTVLDQEVWNVYRTAYDKLVLAVGQDWYDYQISDNKVARVGGEPSDLTSRVYVNSPDGKQSLWVDRRDGKGVLLAYDIAANADKGVHEQSGLTNPVRWLSDKAVVFRVATSQETADYVMSLDGGEPKKIKNVTNTAGIDRWYYY